MPCLFTCRKRVMIATSLIHISGAQGAHALFTGTGIRAYTMTGLLWSLETLI